VKEEYVTTPTIRRATVEDADAVMAMVLAIAQHEGQLEHILVSADTWRDMLGRPEVLVLLAEVNSAPVGYVSAVRILHLWSGGDIIWLDDLYVAESSRNGGIGAQLMREMAQLAAADGLIIRWEMQADNHSAERFYRRLGATIRTKKIAAWRPGQRP
jgi:GNAT superfamily N-acetyltransferase